MAKTETARKRTTSQRVLYFAGILLTAAVLATWGLTRLHLIRHRTPPLASEPLRVRVLTADPSALEGTALYAGQILPRVEADLAFQVGGRIIERRVDAGNPIAPGQVLMRIDTGDLTLARQQAAAELATARAELDFQRLQVERYRQLYAERVVSTADRDRHEQAYATALARVRQAGAALAESGRQQRYADLRAPQAGVISEVLAEAGQVVSAGQPVLRMNKSGDLEAEIYIPEQSRANLQAARRIDVTLWALPGVVLPGRLRTLDPQADPNTRTYRARIALIDPPAAVKAGMSASVRVPDPRAEGLLVPVAAILQTDARPTVWVVGSDDRVRRRGVTLGGYAGDQVRVTGGLAPGESVVTAGINRLSEGLKVRPWKEGQE
jgi:RND family efflux transporter MFP subunit